MRANDEVTAEYIKDLETLLDLKTAECEEKDARIAALKGQLAILRQDRRYEVSAG